MNRNSLNSRKVQVIWALVPIALAGLVLELPFFWRAMKTRKSGDIKAAVGFGVAQIIVYVAFAADQSERADQVSNLTGAVVWFCAFAAAVYAAWLYRPLDKEELMDQASRDQRPGSSYLH